MSKAVAIQKIFYFLFLIITTLLICSCAAAPKPKMHLETVPLAKDKYDINCALLINDSLGASNIKLLDWKINKDHIPKKDLTNIIYAHFQNITDGLCSATTRAVDPDNVNSKIDFYVQPRFLSATPKCDGGTMFANCSFSIDIALFILDRNNIPILEFFHSGYSASKHGSGFSYIEIAEQRAFDAITDGFIGLSKKVNSDEMVDFVINNRDFFKLDDVSKVQEVEKLLSDRNDNEINSMLISYASELEKTDLLRRILELRVSPNIAFGIDGTYPIHRAAYNNNVEMLNLLIEYDANLEQEDDKERTALYFAAWNNYDEIIEMLLNHGVSYENVNEESNLFISAAIYEKFGDYFINVNNKKDAIVCYEKSLLFYRKAELYFDEIYDSARNDIFWANFKEVVIPAISAFAASYQAQQQAESMAEISALINRGEGVGYGSASYISSLDIDTTLSRKDRDEAEKYIIKCKTKITLLDNTIGTVNGQLK